MKKTTTIMKKNDVVEANEGDNPSRLIDAKIKELSDRAR